MSIWRQTKKPWYYISRVTLNEQWNWLEPLFRSLRIKFVNLFLDVLSMLNFLPTSNALNGWPKDLCYINQNATTRKIKLYCKIYRLLCKSEAFNSFCNCLRECTKSKFAFFSPFTVVQPKHYTSLFRTMYKYRDIQSKFERISLSFYLC